MIAQIKNKPIQKGSIVKYEDGYFRVTAYFSKGQTMNLGSIFGGKIYHRGVSEYDVKEAHDEWYEGWTKSETYMCM